MIPSAMPLMYITRSGLLCDTPSVLKDILKELDSLHEKKNTLMQEYSSSKSDMKNLYQIRKNYEKYMGKEIER